VNLGQPVGSGASSSTYLGTEPLGISGTGFLWARGSPSLEGNTQARSMLLHATNVNIPFLVIGKCNAIGQTQRRIKDAED